MGREREEMDLWFPRFIYGKQRGTSRRVVASSNPFYENIKVSRASISGSRFHGVGSIRRFWEAQRGGWVGRDVKVLQ